MRFPCPDKGDEHFFPVFRELLLTEPPLPGEFDIHFRKWIGEKSMLGVPISAAWTFSPSSSSKSMETCTSGGASPGSPFHFFQATTLKALFFSWSHFADHINNSAPENANSTLDTHSCKFLCRLGFSEVGLTLPLTTTNPAFRPEEIGDASRDETRHTQEQHTSVHLTSPSFNSFFTFVDICATQCNEDQTRIRNDRCRLRRAGWCAARPTRSANSCPQLVPRLK